MTPLHALAATDLLAGYRAGTLSPVAVTEAVLARIDRWEPHLHALYALDRDGALCVARGFSYCIALEAALKLKEATGLWAEGFSSADLRHGPRAAARRLPALVFHAGGALAADVEAVEAELADAGSVTIARISSDLEVSGAARTIDQSSTGMAGSVEAGDQLGAAVSSARHGPSVAYLVGAPGEDVGRARDAGLVQEIGNGKAWTQRSAGVPGTVESGDRLGASLGGSSATGATRSTTYMVSSYAGSFTPVDAHSSRCGCAPLAASACQRSDFRKSRYH